MKQINIVNAYIATDKLSKADNLTINGKWVLYKLRKDLSTHYDFYVQQSRELFEEYKEYYNESTDVFDFESAEDAKKFKEKQKIIDDFEVEYAAKKPTVKLSDIPDITVQYIEVLDEFIEFIPE